MGQELRITLLIESPFFSFVSFFLVGGGGIGNLTTVGRIMRLGSKMSYVFKMIIKKTYFNVGSLTYV